MEYFCKYQIFLGKSMREAWDVWSLREKSYKILLKSYKIINDGYFNSRYSERKERAEMPCGVFLLVTQKARKAQKWASCEKLAMRGGIV